MAETYVKAGCTAIEVDFPSHRPFLEGDFIAGRMKKALESCGDYGAYMQGMAEMKKRLPETKLILMAYENTILEIGTERFIGFCKENGFFDAILVGNEGDAVKTRLIAAGIRVSCYVQFQMDEAEVDNALHSNGFVYLQAFPGLGQVDPRYPTLKACIAELRRRGLRHPIYCGVGVRTPEDVAVVKEAGADGVFVGSTILKLHDDRPALIKKIGELEANC